MDIEGVDVTYDDEEEAVVVSIADDNIGDTRAFLQYAADKLEEDQREASRRVNAFAEQAVKQRREEILALRDMMEDIVE